VNKAELHERISLFYQDDIDLAAHQQWLKDELLEVDDERRVLKDHLHRRR